jgi:ketosteroid isomerase-like protein
MDFVAAYNRRDFDAAVDFFHPEVDWVLPALQRSDSCRGPEEVRRFSEGLDETFDELTLKPQETVDAGDRVAVRLRHYGRGKGSGLEMDTELYHQVTHVSRRNDGEDRVLRELARGPRSSRVARVSALLGRAATSPLPIHPGEDGAGVGDNRSVGQLERRELRVPGHLAQLVTRALAQEGDRTAVSGDHLVVFDSRGAERLLHPATGMYPRPAVITGANEQRGPAGHGSS